MRSDQDLPVFSVVLLTYNPRPVVQETIESLLGQRVDAPFEIIVVHSGGGVAIAPVDPRVRVIRHARRLLPGPARNAGVATALGRYIAFCSDDTPPVPTWLAQRLEVHRAGFEIVGGSIANGTPRSLIGTAGYLLEYSTLMPREALLRQQPVPHALSFDRGVFNRFGWYPEDTVTGEDTVFNERCIRGGVEIGFAAGASLEHRNLTRLWPMLRHAYSHGTGLYQSMHEHGHESHVGDPGAGKARAALAFLVAYPARGWRVKLRRLRTFAPDLLPIFALLSPIIVAAMFATGLGALAEWQRRRPR
jgi:glycosyltransferase involved in cell wall biosynthesis